jgi:hypothetical protein
MTFEFKSNGKFVGVLFGTLRVENGPYLKIQNTNFIR